MNVEAREIWLKDGEKLILRSPKPEDSAVLLEFLKTTNAESYRNMNKSPGYWDSYTIEKEAEILANFIQSKTSFMIAAFTADGKVVGNIGFFGFTNNPFTSHSGSVGMGIINAYQNRRLGSQLLRTLMFEAKALNYHRLELTVRTYNESGIALYEKTGFRRIGLLKDIAFIDGAYVDEYAYDLILQ